MRDFGERATTSASGSGVPGRLLLLLAGFELGLGLGFGLGLGG